jgi:hypothetical protein
MGVCLVVTSQIDINIIYGLPTVGQPNPSIDGSGLAAYKRVNLIVSRDTNYII